MASTYRRESRQHEQLKIDTAKQLVSARRLGETHRPLEDRGTQRAGDARKEKKAALEEMDDPSVQYILNVIYW